MPEDKINTNKPEGTQRTAVAAGKQGPSIRQNTVRTAQTAKPAASNLPSKPIVKPATKPTETPAETKPMKNSLSPAASSVLKTADKQTETVASQTAAAAAKPTGAVPSTARPAASSVPLAKTDTTAASAAKTAQASSSPAQRPPMAQYVEKPRTAIVTRKTGETDITLTLNLDGTGKTSIDTGIGFFDHMLNSFARHGFFDIDLKVRGDLYVDSHHTIEDTGIVLGTAIKEALGAKKAIKRYGSFMLPMDEALVLCALDLSGRPYLVYDLKLTVDKVGYMDTEMVKEFFYAVSYSAGMNINIKQLDGQNNHHIIEAAFKAFAKALDEAVAKEPRLMGQVLSTKGTL